MEKEILLKDGSCTYREQGPGGIEITGYRGSSGSVELPDTIEGRSVTSIRKKAFLSKKNLKKIVLPKSIETVGEWAFTYCSSLKTIKMPRKRIEFGKGAFKECSSLREFILTEEDGADEDIQSARLLAASITMLDASYLLDTEAAGTASWLKKWDARLMNLIREDDSAGFLKIVMCGEEDYGSVENNLDHFQHEKRKGKVRMALLRLLNQTGMKPETGGELTEYLLSHTKGCCTEETWEVILQEHGNDREYYKLFYQIGCITPDNFGDILTDIGEDHAEMKAYFMRKQEEEMGHADFFDMLSLD